MLPILPTKRDPTIQGLCEICGVNKQTNTGKGIYSRKCSSCGRKGKKHLLPVHRQHKKDVCEECGFVPVHPCQLDVDHIDGDSNNNDPSNFKTLCANCHRLKTHLAGENHNPVYRTPK